MGSQSTEGDWLNEMDGAGLALLWEAAANASVGGIGITDLTGTVLYVNRALVRMWGFASPDEMVGRQLSEFWEGAGILRTVEALNGIGHAGGEDLAKRKDGSVFPVQFSATRVADPSGHPRFLFGSFVDISKRKDREADLVESESRYYRLFEESQDAIYISSPAGRVLDCNRAFLDLFGYSRLEIRAVDVRGLYASPAARAAFQQRIERDGFVRDFPVELLAKGGRVMECLLTARVAEVGVAKDPTYEGIVRDVTAGNRVVQRLEESEARYRKVSELISDYAYAFTVEPDRSLTSEWVAGALERITGFTTQELAERGGWSVLIYPDDLPIEYGQLETLLQGRESAVEYRIVTKGGDTLWMRDVARAEWDEKEQRTTRVEGAVRDITARRLAQERQREMLQGAIEAVSRTSEARDPYTAGHQRKVAELAGAIAEKLGLGGEIVEELRTAGLLHDVGKISVPAGILDKPSKLSEVEYELAKNHVNVSYDILKEIPFANGVAHAVLHHHERLDGSGYPDGLRGDEIVLEARILAVADVVEAMSSHRPYRPALGIEAALEEIDDGAGIRYDQSVVEACTKLFESEGFAFSESS